MQHTIDYLLCKAERQDSPATILQCYHPVRPFQYTTYPVHLKQRACHISHNVLFYTTFLVKAPIILLLADLALLASFVGMCLLATHVQRNA